MRNRPLPPFPTNAPLRSAPDADREPPAPPKMWVLHIVAGAATGGAETFCLDTITALAERGIEQKVLCRPHRQNLDRLRQLSIDFEPLSFATASRLTGAPAFIRRTAAGWEADLVHAWMSRAASFVPADMPCPVIGWMGGY